MQELHQRLEKASEISRRFAGGGGVCGRSSGCRGHAAGTPGVENFEEAERFCNFRRTTEAGKILNTSKPSSYGKSHEGIASHPIIAFPHLTRPLQPRHTSSPPPPLPRNPSAQYPSDIVQGGKGGDMEQKDSVLKLSSLSDSESTHALGAKAYNVSHDVYGTGATMSVSVGPEFAPATPPHSPQLHPSQHETHEPRRAGGEAGAGAGGAGGGGGGPHTSWRRTRSAATYVPEIMALVQTNDDGIRRNAVQGALIARHVDMRKGVVGTDEPRRAGGSVLLVRSASPSPSLRAERTRAGGGGHDGESSGMGSQSATARSVSSPSRHEQSIRARTGDRQNENRAHTNEHRSHTNFQQIIRNSKQLIQNFKQNVQNLTIFAKS